MSIRDHFIRCASQGESYMMHADEQIGQRMLNRNKINKYLANIPNKLSKEFAEIFIKQIKYVPFDTFYSAFQKSYNKFLSAIKNRPYCILLNSDHYGSESWLTQLLFQNQLKGREPEIIHKSTPNKDPIDIVIVDDAIYSGINILSQIDDFIYYAKPGLTNHKYIFHIVVPYVSFEGHQMLCENIGKFNNSKYCFYPAGPLIPSIWKSTNLDKFTKGQQILKSEIAKNLRIEEGSALIPLYFDHKIACPLSTATHLLNQIINLPPSKQALYKAKTKYYEVKS